MKFECGDLERALAVSDLMPEAREHLKNCAACRREYRLWTDISSTAKELHQDWETPGLWDEIRKKLQAEPKLKEKPVWWKEWKALALAALIVISAGLLIVRNWRQPPANSKGTESAQVLPISGNRDFLTDQALREVERTEVAYRQSIDKLSQLAESKLQNPATAVAVNCKEKLLMLDSAISETRANLDQNRFNVRLQTELADLYREKQQTLKELLTRDQKN
ncbi:MAG: hypothetical protein JOZ48_22315 [Acidobacteriaceae bacterium]|nr:hypothetical protein [Acidobacteriaceae bacterium]